VEQINAKMPTNEKSNGPCTKKALHPVSRLAPFGAFDSSQTMDSSSFVRVQETNPGAFKKEGSAGMASEGSRQIAYRWGRRIKVSGFIFCSPMLRGLAAKRVRYNPTAMFEVT
jgi:hypothetical protein